MMRPKIKVELPTAKIRPASNTSSSSNSVIYSVGKTQGNQLSFQTPALLSTLEKDLYKQRYFVPEHEEEAPRYATHTSYNDEDDANDADYEDDEDVSNFLDMEEEEIMPEDEDIEKLMDNLPPSPPSSPPRELLPDRLYALYDFEGPDPNHLQLLRNDPVELLNDEDNYWWLVKNLNNFNIGFVPLEFLENYDERLLRLNCWKNEQHEKEKKQQLMDKMPDHEIITINGDRLIDFNKVTNTSQSPALGGAKKNVSFNIKEDSKRPEVLSEIYSDYTPLIINKNPSYLSKQNFLVKSLDSYSGPRPPQQIFKEDSIGSFSSDTTITTLNTNNGVASGSIVSGGSPGHIIRSDSMDMLDANLSNSIKMLDDYIREQTTVPGDSTGPMSNSRAGASGELEDFNDNTMANTSSNTIIVKDNESLSSQDSNNSLSRNNTTTTPLTSESYLVNNDSFVKYETNAEGNYVESETEHEVITETLTPVDLTPIEVEERLAERPVERQVEEARKLEEVLEKEPVIDRPKMSVGTKLVPRGKTDYINMIVPVTSPTQKYHPFVHELFDDLVREIEGLSMIVQQHL